MIMFLIIFLILIIVILASRLVIEAKDIDNKKIDIKLYLRLLHLIKIPIKFSNKRYEIKILKILTTINENKKNIAIEKFKVFMKFGVENTSLTAYTYGIVSIIIEIICQIINLKPSEKNIIKVQPCFNKNIFKIYIDCIFSIKTVHIMNIIYVLKRRV